MGIGHHELPKDGGGIAKGKWHVGLNSPLNANMGGVHFEEGRTVKPIDGRHLRRLISAMGNSILWARREEDGFTCGEVPDDLVAVRARMRGIYDRAVAAGLQEAEDPADMEAAIAADAAGIADASPEEVERRFAEIEADLEAAIADHERAKAIGEPESESESESESEPLYGMNQKALREFAREHGIDDKVDLRLGANALRDVIRELMKT